MLREHIDSLRKYGGSPQPPATAEEVRALRARARKELGVELPDAYCELLGMVDGLDSNGMVIYGCRTACIVGYDDRWIQGIVDANLIWWELEAHKEYLFLGDSGISLYTLQLPDRKYQLQDRPSGSVLEEFASFEELLYRALEENRP
jgi:hypothetical protein